MPAWEKLRTQLRGREEWEIQAPNAGPDADAATCRWSACTWRYAVGPLDHGERTMAAELLSFLLPNDLVLLDRGFWSYGIVSSDPKAKSLLRHPPVETNQAAPCRTPGVRKTGVFNGRCRPVPAGGTAAWTCTSNCASWNTKSLAFARAPS